LKPADVLRSKTVKTALPEDGDNERRYLSECQSNKTCCMKHSVLNFGLIKGKINYIYAVFIAVMSKAAVYHLF